MRHGYRCVPHADSLEPKARAAFIATEGWTSSAHDDVKWGRRRCACPSQRPRRKLQPSLNMGVEIMGFTSATVRPPAPINMSPTPSTPPLQLKKTQPPPSLRPTPPSSPTRLLRLLSPPSPSLIPPMTPTQSMVPRRPGLLTPWISLLLLLPWPADSSDDHPQEDSHTWRGGRSTAANQFLDEGVRRWRCCVSTRIKTSVHLNQLFPILLACSTSELSEPASYAEVIQAGSMGAP